MEQLEALKAVYNIALESVDFEKYDEYSEEFELVEALIEEVSKAEDDEYGAVTAALEVLKEQGSFVVLMVSMESVVEALDDHFDDVEIEIDEQGLRKIIEEKVEEWDSHGNEHSDLVMEIVERVAEAAEE